MNTSEAHKIISGIFILLWMISWFAAAWIWLWNIYIAIALGMTGGISLIFALLFSVSVNIIEWKGE